jgi:hypothetical protein
MHRTWLKRLAVLALAVTPAACTENIHQSNPLGLEPGPRLDAVGGGCTISADTGPGTGCGVTVEVSPASPFLRQSSLDPVQTGPITVVFSKPVSNVRVSGSGAISCNHFVGALVGYDSAGTETARQSLTLIDPEDCGDDGVTFGAQAALAGGPFRKVVIEPMSPFQFPVFDLTGNSTAEYTLSFDEAADSARIALTPARTGTLRPSTHTSTNPLCTSLQYGPQRRDYTLALTRGTGSASTPVTNASVTLVLTAIDASGGHVGHTGERPVGSFEPGQTAHTTQTTVTTDGQGRARFTFEAPEFGGRYVITARAEGAPDKADTVTVGIAGLATLAASTNYNLIGATGFHPDAHYGTGTMRSALVELADSFHVRFGSVLEYNDVALSQGGRFDIAGNWVDTHHCDHRWGQGADLRTITLSAAQQNYVRLKWARITGTNGYVNEGAPVHYHLKTSN